MLGVGGHDMDLEDMECASSSCLSVKLDREGERALNCAEDAFHPHESKVSLKIKHPST